VTEENIRLVASAAELALFPADLMQTEETNWSVVQVSEGRAAAADAVGVVERITGPLSALAVPVMYVSTFAEEFVLIPVDRLDDAMRHLRTLDPGVGSQAHTPTPEDAPPAEGCDAGPLPPPILAARRRPEVGGKAPLFRRSPCQFFLNRSAENL
jgi:hypothetical protein